MITSCGEWSAKAPGEYVWAIEPSTDYPRCSTGHRRARSPPLKTRIRDRADIQVVGPDQINGQLADILLALAALAELRQWPRMTNRRMPADRRSACCCKSTVRFRLVFESRVSITACSIPAGLFSGSKSAGPLRTGCSTGSGRAHVKLDGEAGKLELDVRVGRRLT